MAPAGMNPGQEVDANPGVPSRHGRHVPAAGTSLLKILQVNPRTVVLLGDHRAASFRKCGSADGGPNRFDAGARPTYGLWALARSSAGLPTHRPNFCQVIDC